MSESSSCPSSYSCSPSPETSSINNPYSTTPNNPFNTLSTPIINVQSPNTPSVRMPPSPFIPPYDFVNRTPTMAMHSGPPGGNCKDLMSDIRSFIQVSAVMQGQYMRNFGAWAALQTSRHLNSPKLELPESVPVNMSPLYTPTHGLMSPSGVESVIGSPYLPSHLSRTYSVINQASRMSTHLIDNEEPADPGGDGDSRSGRQSRPAKIAKKDDSQTDPEQNIQDLEELDKFANKFKQARLKHGFTQQDVGMALGKLYGTDFSQTTISRFEALNLSFRNMCKLKPQLEQWIADMDSAVKDGNVDPSQPRLKPIPMEGLEDCESRRRKKRTSIAQDLRKRLEQVFNSDPRPKKSLIAKLAEELESDKDTIRVWFCNRRQKARKSDEAGCTELQQANYGLCVCTEGSLLSSLDSSTLARKTVALNNIPLDKTKPNEVGENEGGIVINANHFLGKACQ